METSPRPRGCRHETNCSPRRERMAIGLTVNGTAVSVTAEPDTPPLWVLREHLKLTGTKFGCGSGLCGACTVHIDGKATRSCQTALSQVQGKQVTTIEGLSANSDHPLQKAWVAEQVPQCGYCQSGQIMQAAELLATTKTPTRAQIVAHMDGNICRCGTYPRIVRAIERAAREGQAKTTHVDTPTPDTSISRRGFVKGAAGLTFAFTFGGTLLGRMAEAVAQPQTAAKLNAWVTIGADNAITILCPSSEMGQGVLTALPLILAEELDADWSKVKCEFAPGNPKVYGGVHKMFPGAQVTLASVSVPSYYMPLRTAGAQARKVLLDSVAKEWNVPVEELTTEPSMVVHA